MVSYYYICGGFSLNRSIITVNACIARPNLVDVPAILTYNYKKIKVKNINIHFYVNTMNVCIFLVEYGMFENEYNMWDDYNLIGNRYTQTYNLVIETINNQFI